MTGQIVEYHEVAGLPGGGQELFVEACETKTVERPLQHQRRARAVEVHGRHDGGCFPGSTRNRFHSPCPSLGPATQAGQIGLRAEFVHENESFRIHVS